MTKNEEAAALIGEAQAALDEAKGMLAGKPSSREGKVHIGAYLPAEFKTKIHVTRYRRPRRAGQHDRDRRRDQVPADAEAARRSGEVVGKLERLKRWRE